MQELLNEPGIVIYNNKVTPTSKVKKFIEKNQLKEYSLKYVENPSPDFKILNKQLQDLVDEHLGIQRIKKPEIPKNNSEYEYTFRLNSNSVLCAHSKEDLDKLKKWYYD